MTENKEHIRFFYSSFSILTSFKERIVKDKAYTILETKRKLLEIDFCLSKPLVALQKDTYSYVYALCKSYNRRRRLNGLDMMNILKAFFFLLATKQTSSNNNVSITRWLRKASNWNVDNLLDGDLTLYAVTYFRLILKMCNSTTIPAITTLNFRFAADREFYALKDKNYSILYEIIEQDLTNANRMQSAYQLSCGSFTKPMGYEDFTIIWYTLGKIFLWQQLGMELKSECLDDIFIRIFNKKRMFFDY